MAAGLTALTQENRPPSSTPPPTGRRIFWKGLFALLLVAEIGLFVAHQIPARYTIEPKRPEATEMLRNFYELEPDPAGGHRWSYPQAEIFLAAIDASPTVRLYIDDQLPSGTPQRKLSYGLVGQPSQNVPLQRGLATYELTGQAGSGFGPPIYVTRNQESFIEQLWLSGPVLRLETSPYQPKGDRRQLGIVVQAVEVKAGLTTGRVGLPTLTNLLLTAVITLASFILLSSFRLSGRRKAFGTLLAVAPWLALVGFARVALADNIELVVMLILLAILALTAARFAGPLALTDTRNRLTRTRKPYHPSEPPQPTEQTSTIVNRGLAPSGGKSQIAASLPLGVNLIYFLSVGVALFAFAIHLFAFRLPERDSDYDTRSFGLYYLLKLPWPLIAVFGLAVILATFPASNRWLATRLERVANWQPLAGWGWKTRLTVGLVLFGSVVAFCLIFRTQLDYGDYDQIVYKLERLKQLDALPGPENFLIWREGEILDYALHFLLWRALENTGWWQPAYTYSVTSALAGGIYALIAWGLGRSLTRQRVGRILITGLLLTVGGTLVFMGYVESYTLVTLTAMLYVLAAVWAFAPPSGPPISIIWPAALLGIAILLHPLALFLGPSYIVGLLWRADLAAPRFNWRKLAIEASQSLIIGGLLLGSLVLFMGFYNYTWTQWDIGRHYVGGADQSLFKPLFQARPGTYEFYPILSGYYFGFQFNLQMILAPLSLPLLAGLVASAARQLNKVWQAAGLIIFGVGLFVIGATIIAGQPLIWLMAIGLALQLAGLWLARRHLTNPAGLVLGTAALYTWLFSLTWNPDLGTQDWDLLSLNGFFTTLLMGYWLVERLAQTSGWLARITVALLTCSVCLWFAWIGYNAFFH